MNENVKGFIVGVASLVLIVLIGFAASSFFGTNQSNGQTVTGNVVATEEITGDFQQVDVSFGPQGYILEPSTVQKNVPVRMVFDMDRVFGCMRDVVIPSQNIRKVLRNDDNVIQFTPTEIGTFNIACSMNMRRGSFTVVD